MQGSNDHYQKTQFKYFSQARGMWTPMEAPHSSVTNSAVTQGWTSLQMCLSPGSQTPRRGVMFSRAEVSEIMDDMDTMTEADY